MRQAARASRATGAAGAYETTPMVGKYIGEETGRIWGTKVKYLSDAERAGYQISVRDGKLYDAAGNLLDTSKASSVFSGQGTAIYVMDDAGNIFVSSQRVGKFHHSSLLGGRPVAAAGEMSVEQGVIRSITRRSGHYLPEEKFLQQMISELEKRGADLGSATISKGF